MSSFESPFLRRLRGVTTNNNKTITRTVPGQIIVSKQTISSDDNIVVNNINSNNSNLNHTAESNSTNKDSDSSNNNQIPESISANNNSSKPKYISSYRYSQFEQLLNMDNVDLAALRKLSWNGIPFKYRTDVWQMLLGYLPTNKDRRSTALQKKRKEYMDSIPIYYTISEADRTTTDGENLRQIQVDLPRTSPNVAFFQQELVQKAMQRILYIWSVRHPASGYVQGMNDLLTPLFLICLQPYCTTPEESSPLRCDVAVLDTITLSNVEADTYWCLTKLLDNIQDHYTFGQPGLQRMTLRLEDLIHRLDIELHTHFQTQGVMFQFFTTRWMNCVLMRELPLRSIIRLWDTYFAEEHGGFENFHVYVCAVLLKTFRDKLITLPFQEILLFLQNLPTIDWDEEEVEPILSQAFILSTLFDSSPNHLMC